MHIGDIYKLCVHILLFSKLTIRSAASSSNVCTWLPLLVFCKYEDRQEKTLIISSTRILTLIKLGFRAAWGDTGFIYFLFFSNCEMNEIPSLSPSVALSLFF